MLSLCTLTLALARELNREAWHVVSANGSVAVPTSLPAVAHTALLDAGVLKGDPFYRFNERDWSWVGLEDWRFNTSFALSQAEVAAAQVLQLDGVDTVAQVVLNGRVIGSTDDAFIRWRFAVPAGLLRAGTNSLVVSFTAPRTAAIARATAYPYEVPASIYYHTWSGDPRGRRSPPPLSPTSASASSDPAPSPTRAHEVATKAYQLFDRAHLSSASPTWHAPRPSAAEAPPLRR